MVKKFTPYKFTPPLIEGIIQERKGSFVMMVKVKNEIMRCHCPTMCSIGNIESLKNFPCLLSQNTSKGCNTKYTVEAISLDSKNKKNKKWIGINQVKANKYFEYFLKQGRFKEIFPNEIKKVQREKFFQKSKFDFKIDDDTFLEVKTPLHFLSMKIPKNIKIKKTKLSPGDRLVKHMNDLKEYLKLKKRAILVKVCMYDSDGSSQETVDNSFRFNEVSEAFEECFKMGLESYQVNFKINEKEIDVDKVLKLNNNFAVA